MTISPSIVDTVGRLKFVGKSSHEKIYEESEMRSQLFLNQVKNFLEESESSEVATSIYRKIVATDTNQEVKRFKEKFRNYWEVDAGGYDSKRQVYQLPDKLIIVKLNGHTIATLPKLCQDINDEIDISKEILELKDDWDDEGAKAYKPRTWKTAVKLLAEYATKAFEEKRKLIPKPLICPGPDGSIDILWKTTQYRLLVNVPEKPNESVTFYGDDYKSSKINGTIHSVEKYVELFNSLLGI